MSDEPAVPAGGTGTTHPRPPRGLAGWLLALPVYLYRAHLGFLLGHRFLVLVHRGRRTGRRHETPLEVVRYDAARGEAIVAAGWGRRTAWLRNVEDGLAEQIWIGRKRYLPAVRHVDPDEAVILLGEYERRSGIPRPIVHRVLSWLLGWRYDGSPDARRRAAEQLPMVGFRPGAPDSGRPAPNTSEARHGRHVRPQR